jgi:sensor histidine kinase YesM
MTEEMIRAVMEGRAHTGDENRYSTGIAMDNVIHRLQLYYNQEHLLQIESEGIGKGTQVTILLPLE